MSGTYNLFVYGTLVEEACVNEVIGRVPEMRQASIEGFHRFFDTDIGYYSARKEEGASIDGILLMGLVHDEIRMLDEYEGVRYDVYRRVEVLARSDGELVRSYIYVKGKNMK